MIRNYNYKRYFSRLLILVEEYSRNKNTIERTIDLREYLAIFICDVSTELGHFQTVKQKKIITELKYGSFVLIIRVIIFLKKKVKNKISIICLHKNIKTKKYTITETISQNHILLSYTVTHTS